MAADQPIAKSLRWLFFVVGVGGLIACGIYIGRALGSPEPTGRLLSALMFLLLGFFFVLMYGENRSRGKGA